MNVNRVKYDNVSGEKRFTFLDLVDLSWRRKLYNTYACKGKRKLPLSSIQEHVVPVVDISLLN